MSVEEMKKSIHEQVEKLSPEQLEKVNEFMIRFNTLPDKEWNLTEHVQNILSEREEVLKKLAQ